MSSICVGAEVKCKRSTCSWAIDYLDCLNNLWLGVAARRTSNFTFFRFKTDVPRLVRCASGLFASEVSIVTAEII